MIEITVGLLGRACKFTSDQNIAKINKPNRRNNNGSISRIFVLLRLGIRVLKLEYFYLLLHHHQPFYSLAKKFSKKSPLNELNVIFK